MRILEKTESVCPVCFQEGKIHKIEAQIIEKDGKVYITKKCDTHGLFSDIFFSDVNLYKKWMKYLVTGPWVPDVKTQVFDYPELYPEHYSPSLLTNLLITNRCNLRCSYCFMNAGVSGFVYEPTLDQLKDLMIQARHERPMGSTAIQITGGEPTVRDDLIDIITLAKELGFTHVQLNTNGIKLAESVEYCRQIKDAKVNTVYLSFDGITRKTNVWVNQSKQTIKNLRKAGLHVVLVPVVIGGKNLHEVGKLIQFAIDNMDIIRGVNFQPISFAGRAKKLDNQKRNQQRVDYVQMMEVIEKEFDGQISRDDFYPVPFVNPISQLIEMLKGKNQVGFTAHPGCGGATYLFVDSGKPIPITRFIDVERLMSYVSKESKIRGPLKKIRVTGSFLKHLNDFVDEDKAPQGFNIIKLLKDAAMGGSYNSLRGFHHKSIFIGSMWFQDPFNLNIERLKRCVIHYSTPEGIIPFCLYNGLGLGDKIREKYSNSIKEWETKTGKKMRDDLWKGGPINDIPSRKNGN